MSAQIAAWGRLVANPEARTTKAGKPWATARLAVTMPLPYGAAEGMGAPTLWLGVTVFGERLTETLARHVKGECVSVAGRLEMRPYTGGDGTQRDGWTVIAESVIGPRSPRPSGRKRQPAQPAADPAPDPEKTEPPREARSPRRPSDLAGARTARDVDSRLGKLHEIMLAMARWAARADSANLSALCRGRFDARAGRPLTALYALGLELQDEIGDMRAAIFAETGTDIAAGAGVDDEPPPPIAGRSS